VLLFAWMAVRFWHPYYGFTRLLQFDEAAARVMLPKLRGQPIFLNAGENGYDGLYYAQLAATPTLQDPGLERAIDAPAYRGRRMLLGWIASGLALGEPGRAVQVYAGLNLVLWFCLAALLWRALPPGDGRATFAWAGLLFSAGLLHCVRLSLTDQLALVLLLLAWGRVEKGRILAAGFCLGLAALARETALLGVVMLIPAPGRGGRKSVPAALAAGAPLALWLGYLQWRFGPGEPGLGNLTWPLLGWIRKWWLELPDLASDNYRWLATTTLLAQAGLTVQAAWLLWRRDWNAAAWRLGAGFVALMALLGQAVWEGHPGAATRVLLPLTAAFNLTAVRGRARWGWLAAGNLGVFAGVLALWHVPQNPRELTAGRMAGGAWVALADAGWHDRESDGRHTWAWSAQGGVINLSRWPKSDETTGLRCGLRAPSARPVEIRQGARVLWRGEAGEKRQEISFAGVEFREGRASLEFVSPARPATVEGDSRPLGLAVYDVEPR